MKECPNCYMDRISKIVFVGCVLAFLITALLLILLYYNGPIRQGRWFNDANSMRCMQGHQETRPENVLPPRSYK